MHEDTVLAGVKPSSPLRTGGQKVGGEVSEKQGAWGEPRGQSCSHSIKKRILTGILEGALG